MRKFIIFMAAITAAISIAGCGSGEIEALLADTEMNGVRPQNEPAEQTEDMPETPASEDSGRNVSNIPESPVGKDVGADVLEIPKTPAGESLSDIQNKNGVYIKRGDRFFKIGRHSAKQLDYIMLTVGGVSYDPNYYIVLGDKSSDEYLRFISDDQLVFVGYEPSFYQLYSLGFTAKNNVLYKFSYGEHSLIGYTHIDGLELSNNPQLRDLHYFKVESGHSMVSGWLLVGNKGQELTLGRWEGTSWIEDKVTIDTEFFRVGEKIEYTTTKTYDGYFIIDFNNVPSGLVCVGDKYQEGYSSVKFKFDGIFTAP